MSHVAIAAALALKDVSAGERLAAFSLASFANREDRAWPGTRVAAVRAGLSRSQYLAAREGLARRRLVAAEEAGAGRGRRSPVVALLFAQTGPWFEGEFNAGLFEAVLGYSRARGSARLLLAALAAVANEELEVSGVTTEEIPGPQPDVALDLGWRVLLRIIPSTDALADVAADLPAVVGEGYENRVREVLRPLRSHFDLVLLDTPPARGNLSATGWLQ